MGLILLDKRVLRPGIAKSALLNRVGGRGLTRDSLLRDPRREGLERAAGRTADPSTTLRSGRDDKGREVTHLGVVSGKRSGGTCCFSPSHSQLHLKSPLSPCHPDRSEAQWRDLQCALRLSQILLGRRPNGPPPEFTPITNPIFAMKHSAARLNSESKDLTLPGRSCAKV